MKLALLLAVAASAGLDIGSAALALSELHA